MSPPDIDKAHARAKLKASLFQIESEPLRVGRYPILRRLGQGGMGTVFAAYDEQLDRKIAVKVMLPARGADASQGRQRMRREAQAMARLSHPNIVAVHEVGEVGDQVFIAMEFVRGMSLDAWLALRSRPWREVLEVFRSAGRGLEAAHLSGLVHRDFKPGNVMIGDDGQVKILDFGLARTSASPSPSPSDDALRPTNEELDGSSEASLTKTGAVVGTPAFMAPEQLLGEQATELSDQFSFCVALYLALYGTRPFPAATLGGLIEAVCEGRVAEPKADVPVPAWIRRVVLRGLAREPRGRHPSMSALLEALAADPGIRRRRWAARGAGLVALLGGGWVVASLGEPEPCPDGREALQSAWDDPRRVRVAQALREGSPHGPDTWSRVEPALDEYAHAWITARDAACHAHRSGMSSDLLYDRRVACLDRSRSALDALVEVFEGADSTVVDKAVSAVAGLPSLARCEDANALLAQVELPPEPIAPEVAALRERLARARSIEDTGRVVESAEIAQQVLARAETLEYLPLVAEALLRHGSGQLIAGEATLADESLGRAAWVAIDSGHDEVAAEAAARRIYVRSEQLGRPSEAAIELPWAQALVAHVDDDALLGLFLHNAAVVEHRAGELLRARERYREALAVKRRLLPPEHPEIANTLANLGRVERDLGDHRLAIDTMREAVGVTEIALGPRHPQRAIIGTILGTLLLEYGLYGEARIELERADAIYREGLGDQAMPRFHVLKAFGELARRQRRWAAARVALQSALALAEPQVGPQHPMLADARLALAEIMAAQGEATAAEALARTAVEQFEAALGRTHPYVASAWLRLGRVLLTLGLPERARPCLERALELEQAQPSAQPSQVGWFQIWVAQSRLATGEVEGVMPQLEQGLERMAQMLPEGSPQLLEARAVVAQARLAMGDRAQALAMLVQDGSAMAGVRHSGDPELAWLRARIAHLRHELAHDATARMQARADLEQACAVLDLAEGYDTEARDARAWLEAIARGIEEISTSP